MLPVCPLPEDEILFETEKAWVFKFLQGSQTWLDARQMAVGGSACAAHLGMSKYTSKNAAVAAMICARKISLTIPMIRGNVGERYLRAHVEKVYGISIQEVGMCIKKDAPWMRASPDGIYRLPDGRLGIVEFKVVSSRKNAEIFYDTYVTLHDGKSLETSPILTEHVHQINYTAGVLGAVEVIYAVLVWGFDSLANGKQPPFILCTRYVPNEHIFEKLYVPTARLAYEKASAWK